MGLAITGVVAFVVAAGWGPYGCSGICTVASPNPDPSASDALARLNPGVALGDVVTICNGSMCTDYTKQQDNRYLGSNRRQQEPPGEVPDLPPVIQPPPPGGGSPGGGGSGPIGGPPKPPKPIVIVYPPE